MTEQPPPFAAAFIKAIELADALGVEKINRMAGCWTHQVDDVWWLAINGHQDDRSVSSSKGMSSTSPVSVPPYAMYVEANGWAAAICDPFGGTILGEHSEDEFIAALDRAIARAGGQEP